MEPASPPKTGPRRRSDYQSDRSRFCAPNPSRQFYADVDDYSASNALQNSRSQNPRLRHQRSQQQAAPMQAASATGLRRRRTALLSCASVFFLTFYLFYTRAFDNMQKSTVSWHPAPAPDTAGKTDKPPSPETQDAVPQAEIHVGGDAPHSDSSPETVGETYDRPDGSGQLSHISMAYGTTARPPLTDIKTIIADMPAELLPQQPPSSAGGGDGSSSGVAKRARRLVIVGDVHGMKTSLQALLAKVKFDRERGDHLILTGDMINKGPDSAGVVELAMSLGASAVRGNHEDRVLLAHRAMRQRHAPGTQGDDGTAPPPSGPDPSESDDPFGAESLLSSLMESVGGSKEKHSSSSSSSGDGDSESDDGKPDSSTAPSAGPDTLEQNPFSHGDHVDRSTAASLSKHQLRWLASLPVILRVGTIRDSPFTNVVVVHAGLVPGLPLDRQDPWAVMNMRTLVYPGRDARRDHTRAEMEVALARRPGRGGVSVPDAAVDAELARRRKDGSRPNDDLLDQVAVPVKGRDGEPWTEAWNRFQLQKVSPEDRRSTVIYGHDAGRGLSVPSHKHAAPGSTFGLDSGCVYGRRLTALVIEAPADGVRHKLVHVECENGQKHKGKKRKKNKKHKKGKHMS